jgi:hypothetical protein
MRTFLKIETMNKTKILLLILSIIILSGCSVLMSKLYGVQDIQYFDEERYVNFVSKIKKQIDCISIISDLNQYKQVIDFGKSEKQKKRFWTTCANVIF